MGLPRTGLGSCGSVIGMRGVKKFVDNLCIKAFLRLPLTVGVGCVVDFILMFVLSVPFGHTDWYTFVYDSGNLSHTVIRNGVMHMVGWFIVVWDWNGVVFDAVNDQPTINIKTRAGNKTKETRVYEYL